MAPPSVHPNGTRYRWLTPPHTPPAKAPLRLLQALQAPRPPAWPAVTTPSKVLSPLGESTGGVVDAVGTWRDNGCVRSLFRTIQEETHG